jgi:hypothetical protein
LVGSISPLPGASALKMRLQPVEGGLVAADHQAIAALQPMHAAGGADIHVMDAPGRQLLAAPDIVLPEGVAAIDQRIVG